MAGEFSFRQEAFRPGQRVAFDDGIRAFKDRRSYVAHVLPTRYGKSDLIRMLALYGQKRGHICQSMVLCPDATLRHQMVDKAKLREMAERYAIPAAEVLQVHEMVGKELDPGANREYLLSGTIQFVQRNLDALMGIIAGRMERTALPFVVFVDESHMLSLANQWGAVAKAVAENGGIAFLMTATPIREDGEAIPGFRCTEEIISPAWKSRTVPDPSDPDRWIREVYEGRSKLVRLEPDVEIGFSDAWAEGALCTLGRIGIDVDLTRYRGQAELGAAKLSGLSASATRKWLSRLTRDPEVMRDVLGAALEQLSLLRKVAPDAAAMVFTGHDEDPEAEADKHAGEVRRIIESLEGRGGPYETVIATSNSEETPSRQLRQFREGRGDILIVKNAGGAGFDCGRIKLVADLSSVRTVPSLIQRITRCATPWRGFQCAQVVALEDPLFVDIWERFVKGEGGEIVDGDWMLKAVEEATKDPPPPQEPELFRVEGTTLAKYDDTLGNIGDLGLYPEVRKIQECFPEFTARFSEAEIARRLGSWKGPDAGERGPDEVCRTLRDRLESIVDELANLAVRRDGYSSAAYGRMRSKLYGEILSAADAPYGSKPSTITDLRLLARMEVAALKLREQWPGRSE